MQPDSQYTHADNAALIFNELTFRSLTRQEPSVSDRIFPASSTTIMVTAGMPD